MHYIYVYVCVRVIHIIALVFLKKNLWMIKGNVEIIFIVFFLKTL